MTVLKRNTLYKVVKVDDYQTHRPQGSGIEAIQVGDTVRIPDEVWAIWNNPSGEWCWGIEQNDKYGASFHTTHLEES